MERILAATAHLLTIFSLPGMLLSTVIWLTHRKRSRYVAVQARQAVLWQTLGHIIVFLAIGLLLLTAILAIGGSDANGVAGQVAGSSLVGSVIGLFLIPVGATVFFFSPRRLLGRWRRSWAKNIHTHLSEGSPIARSHPPQI